MINWHSYGEVFFDNFLTIGVVADILIFQMMDVAWKGKYTVFHFVINKLIN